MDTRKVCITASLFYSSLATGVLDIFLSPTLIEFAHRLNTSVGVINTIYCLSYLVLLGAAFLFGIVFTKVNRNVVVPPTLLVIALTIVTLPWARNIPIFTVILNVVLFARGAYFAAEKTWLKELWKEEAGPYIQALNFFRSLGHLVTPWIFAPFLSNRNRLLLAPTDEETTERIILFSSELTPPELVEITTEGTWSAITLNSSFEPPRSTEESSDLLITPFEILGALLAFAALFQFLIYIIFDLRPFNDGSEEEVGRKDRGEITPFSWETFKRELPLVIFISLSFAGAGAWSFYTLDFLPAFAYFSSLHLSESSAANLLGVTNTFYTLGAFAGIFLNMELNPRDILLGNTLLTASGNLLLLHAISRGGHYELVWWSCAVMGLGFSTAIPCVSAYGQLNMKFDTVVGSIVLICSELVMGAGKVLLGAVIEWFPNLLIYSNLAFVPVVLLSLWGFKSFLHRAQMEESGT